jgi:hypothetical protein
VPDPKVITDYKRATFEFQMKDVHPTDQMDLHKQMGEMVFYTMAHASTTASKLQVSLNNVQTQLNLEKISSFSKDNRIMLASEVTPGLLAGAEPNAHQFLCHDLINGGGRMERDPGNIALTQEPGSGM